jgi:AcrR family transcriptional regulator
VTSQHRAASPVELRPRGPGRPRDEKATRAIHEAALRQLAEHGYAGISLERVAEEAGVARATVYRRYQDKADMVTAAVAADIEELPTRPSQDPRRDLVRFLDAFDARFAAPCLAVIGTLLGADEDPHGIDLHRKRVVEPRAAYARELLVRAQELGELDPGADVDLALQMLVGVVFARRINGVPSDGVWARRAVDAVWRGMAPGAVRPG